MQYSHFRVKFSSADTSRCRKIFCQNILNKFDLWKSYCCFFHRNVILLIFGWRQGSSWHSLLCRISSAGPSANSSKNVFIILASTVDFTSFDRRLQEQNQIQSKENQCHAWYVFWDQQLTLIYLQKASWVWIFPWKFCWVWFYIL